MATALALCAVVVGRLWKKPALTHSLWLLVLLKLVTPPLLPLSVPLPWSWGEAEPAPAVVPTPAAPEPILVAQAPPAAANPADEPPRQFRNIDAFKKNPQTRTLGPL